MRIELSLEAIELAHPIRWRVALLAIAALMLGGCSSSRWVAIIGATANDPASTSFTINIDGCGTLPNPRVVKTETEVRFLVDLKLDGNTKGCLSGAIVHLVQPIGTRTVIDDRRQQVVPMTWSPVASP